MIENEMGNRGSKSNNLITLVKSWLGFWENPLLAKTIKLRGHPKVQGTKLQWKRCKWLE